MTAWGKMPSVLNDLQTRKQIVSTSDDRWYIMCLRSYKTITDKIEGVVLTFVDITRLKQATQELEMRAGHQKAIANLGLFALDKHDIALVLDEMVRLICEHNWRSTAAVFLSCRTAVTVLLNTGTGWHKDDIRKPVSMRRPSFFSENDIQQRCYAGGTLEIHRLHEDGGTRG